MKCSDNKGLMEDEKVKIMDEGKKDNKEMMKGNGGRRKGIMEGLEMSN